MTKIEKENKKKALQERPNSVEEVFLQLYIAKEDIKGISTSDYLTLISQLYNCEYSNEKFYNIIQNGMDEMNPIILQAAKEVRMRAFRSFSYTND